MAGVLSGLFVLLGLVVAIGAMLWMMEGEDRKKVLMRFSKRIRQREADKEAETARLAWEARRRIRNRLRTRLEDRERES